MELADIDLSDIDLTDGRNFVDHVPHEWFAYLRQHAPVYWHPMATSPRGGFWCVTGYDDCVTVNRDWEHFGSYRLGSLFQDWDEANLEQQRLMMLNMDPPMHTRYRRLVNKGFTPRMIGELQQSIHNVADEIIDGICESGSADFVIDVAAELPLVVLAELLGVPAEDRAKMFDWSNRMIGREDAEYQGAQAVAEENAALAAAELYGYAAALYDQKRAHPGG
ncbi:MAG: cytochrome P450, partial [Acidimicrobiales bacterium]